MKLDNIDLVYIYLKELLYKVKWRRIE